MIGLTIEDMAVGDVTEFTRAITGETIGQFVAASGDGNPIHSDPAFAATTSFERVIAPGMLTGSLVSAAIGTQLPGPGAIYLSQSFRFLRPVHVGDTITARVEVAEIVRERNRVRLATVCRNQEGKPVLEGEAWVMPGHHRVEYAGAAGNGLDWGDLMCAPMAIGLRAASLWMVAGLSLASQVLDLYRPGPAAAP